MSEQVLKVSLEFISVGHDVIDLDRPTLAENRNEGRGPEAEKTDNHSIQTDRLKDRALLRGFHDG